MHRLLLSVLALAIPASVATAASYTITNDTYVDSYYLDGVANHQTTNFGSSAAFKGVSSYVDPASGGMYPGYSNVHGLFTLPQTFWTALGVGGPAAGQQVYVQYAIKNNSLTDTGTNLSFQNPRQLELHPLLQSFTAGTGGHPSGSNATQDGTINTPGNYTGTDWLTAKDGVNWTTAGGTSDTTNYVLDDLVSQSGKLAVWNVTSLLANPVTRLEIQTNGFLVQVTEELKYGGNDFASMVSYDGSQNGAGAAPFVTVTPEPATLALLGLTALASVRQRKA